jgi:hypothetical protein
VVVYGRSRETVIAAYLASRDVTFLARTDADSHIFAAFRAILRLLAVKANGPTNRLV